MGVNLTVGPPVYNKAPKPTKTPPAAIFPAKLELQHGGEAFVSIPMPDKLHFSGEVLPEHFIQNYSAGEAVGPTFMELMASGAVAPVIDTWFTEGKYRRVRLSFGSAGAPVCFELRKSLPGSSAAHRLLVQCNPARLGQDGIFDLLDRVNTMTGLKFGRFLADAKVSRLDVAVDVVGLCVPELLATVRKPGKQALYKAHDGTLETYAIHGKQAADSSGKLSQTAQLRPLGPLLLKIYDKRREQVAKGLKPTFGATPVTRIEVSKRRFGNKPCLIGNLANLKNPLAGAKVGLVTSAHLTGGLPWLRYVEAVRACGPDRAAFVCGLSAMMRKQFEKRFAGHPSNVLHSEAIWSHWKSALETTGLIYMIEAAEQLSSGVPLPPGWYE